MELLLPERFERAATAYGYQRVIFEQVAAGVRPPTVSITPSTRHVGVTGRDTSRPGDHSIRVGDRESGMKVVGIAQRVTRRATSVGGIVLVEDEEGLARVLEHVYAAMCLPFRKESVGSLQRAGYEVGVEEVIGAFAAEAALRYGAVRAPLDGRTLALARGSGDAHLVRA
jgi:octanoyl-[GcvH]:protein N-octanoyltransferase